MVKKILLSVEKHPMMTVTRAGMGKKQLVYFILANKKLKYKHGQSRIAYIGTTKNGVDRVAQSAADRVEPVLRLHGVAKMEVRIVTCAARKGLAKSWVKLERAMLLTFKEIYGEIPRCNKKGKSIRENDEFDFFSHGRVTKIVKEMGQHLK